MPQVIPHREQRLNFSLGCYGCREATDLTPGETVLGFPGALLAPLLDALEALRAKAIPKSRAKLAHGCLAGGLDETSETVSVADQADGRIMSAFVRGTKPAGGGLGLSKGKAVSKIQILGTGCKRCRDLTANAERAVQELGIEAEVEKVTEIQDIISFHILMTPGLVIDGQVKAAGRIPSVEEIKQMLVPAGGN